MTEPSACYSPVRPSQSQHVTARGLSHHLHVWGALEDATRVAPPIVMVHGYMDVGASFQFVVDALFSLGMRDRCVIAPDLRGYGLTEYPRTDSYWFPDYLGDLDALLDQLWPDGQVDLLGHSMGGNIAMLYAGVRPQRIRRLVNLEGFGLPDTKPSEAPTRLSTWLDELRTPQALSTYASIEHVQQRLQRNNPRLTADKASWLSRQWSRERAGAHHVLGDPAHKRVNPILYRKEEALACFRRITAPVLWVEGAQTQLELWWGDRYSKREFHERLAVVPSVERRVIEGAGHMLHHDQPDALAALLHRFLGPAT